MKHIQLRLLLIFLLFGFMATELAKDWKSPNILFLASDDLRPELGCFKGPDAPSPVHPVMHTPNLDSLASRSLVLKKAYVQQALCNPSRSSILTSRRPDTTHVYGNGKTDYFRRVGGNFTTIPEFFKNHGYVSVGMGKIFHPGSASGYDDPHSWSEPYYHAPNLDYWEYEVNVSWMAVPRSIYEKKPLSDVQIKDHALETLQHLAQNKDKPFFMAVGFHKPHLPFIFPEEFQRLYSDSDVLLPPNPYAPVNMPSIAWEICPGILMYNDIQELNVSLAINTSMPEFKTLELRRAYYSAVSYMDDLVGQIIQELRNLDLESNTIISFFGDHGYQLSEHGEWCKQTNFELATRAPMMIHIPGRTDKGIETDRITEFVDLFPTLVEAAGFPQLPTCPLNSSKVTLCTEGKSLLPLMDRKEAKMANWRDVAFSQVPRSQGTDVMGYTIRTEQYRYTEWAKFEPAPRYEPLWDQLVGVELYDHVNDPEENVNVADINSYSSVRKTLSQQLRAGWYQQK